MTDQATKQATIKSTGKVIQVYKSKIRGTWISAIDCTTEYQESELIFK